MNDLETLSTMLKNNEWFDSVELDELGRPTVYVHAMNLETLQKIPEKVGGKQVLCHFSAFRKAHREQFVDDRTKPSFMQTQNFTKEDKPLFVRIQPNYNDLDLEVDRLTGICGPSILEQIFWEIHDGKNKVTNLGVKFPDIMDDLSELYSEFGFDELQNALGV